MGVRLRRERSERQTAGEDRKGKWKRAEEKARGGKRVKRRRERGD